MIDNDRENPFASVGGLVTGAYFLGRKHGIDAIESRVIRPQSQRGSVAVIGLPQMGKSCLVNKALIERKEELHRRRLVPITMNLKAYIQPDDFFRDLVSLCKDELEDLNFATSDIKKAARNARREGLVWNDTISNIKRFFKKVREAGIWIIVILDNFDHARSLFGDDTYRIQGFRDLTDFQVAWVVLAHNMIRDIEVHPNTLSDRMFVDYRLGLFEEDEMRAYFCALHDAGVHLTEEQQNRIIFYCGNHPYLLPLLGYRLVEKYRNQSSSIVDVSSTFHEIENRVINSYDKITDLLGDDNRLQKLQQILFDPMYGLEQKDIDTMIAYVLIHSNPEWNNEQADESQPAYVAFSGHFQNYLRGKFSEITFPSRLEQAADALDKIITRRLPSNVERQALPLFTMRATFQNLFASIFNNWETFQPLFGKEEYKHEQYWREGALLLSKMCLPLTQLKVDSDAQVKAQRYCQEILDVLRNLEEPEEYDEWTDVFSWGLTVKNGRLLWGQYEVKETIDYTRHSQVLKVWDRRTKHFFAVKMLRPSPGLKEQDILELSEVLMREASILIDFTHPNIGRVNAAMQNPPAILMQWVDGQSLHQCWEAGNYPTLEEATDIAIKLADALSYAHKERVIHRDIKPKNIILHPKNGPVLIDFDIARSPQVETILKRGEDGLFDYVGTPDYSSPEQIASPERVKSSTDIFSLGLVLYQAVAEHHRRPYNIPGCYHNDPLPELPRASIPDPFYQVLRAMLHQNPDQRPTAQDLHSLLLGMKS